MPFNEMQNKKSLDFFCRCERL